MTVGLGSLLVTINWIYIFGHDSILLKFLVFNRSLNFDFYLDIILLE